MLRAVFCGGTGGSSGVRTPILLNWRRKLAPQPARANGYHQVAGSLSQGLRMRCLSATRVPALGGSNRRLFADGREERRLWSSGHGQEKSTNAKQFQKRVAEGQGSNPAVAVVGLWSALQCPKRRKCRGRRVCYSLTSLRVYLVDSVWGLGCLQVARAAAAGCEPRVCPNPAVQGDQELAEEPTLLRP